MAILAASIASAITSVRSSRVSDNDVISALSGSNGAANHAHGDELNNLCSDDDRDGVLPVNAEVQNGNTETEQQAQYDDLITARISQSRQVRAKALMPDTNGVMGERG